MAKSILLLSLVIFVSLSGFASAQTIANLSLNSTSGNNVTTDNLTCSYALNDTATAAAVAWTRNSTPLMLLYMPFEGNSTNALLDYSGNSVPKARNVGSLAWSAMSGLNRTGDFYFSGGSNTNAIVTGLVNKIGSNFTVSLWMNATAAGTGVVGRLVSDKSTDASTSGFEIYPNTGNTGTLSIYDNAGTAHSVACISGQWSVSAWHHIAVAFNGTSIYVYCDGNNSANITGLASPINNTNSLNLTIGSIAGGTTTISFNGYIDDLRVYNYTLSQSQIVALSRNRTDMIVPPELNVGDVWQCQVTPFNASSAGTTSSSNSVAINANVTAPPVTVALNSPVNSYNSSSSTVDLNWTCSGNSGSFLANLTVDGVLNASGITSPNSTAVDKSVVFADGNHSWSVTCWNGNSVTSALYNFTVDTVNPAIAFMAPTDNSSAVFARQYVSINITAINAGGIKNLTIYLYNSTGLYNSTTGTASSLFVNWTGLPNGVYYFNATAYDNAGNFNKTETRNVTITTFVSVISVTLNSPVNSYNSSSSTVDFNWTCFGNFSSFLSNLTVDGVLNASSIASLNNTAVDKPVVFADGNHNWSVTCLNGTSSNTSALYGFTVDTVNPAISFMTPTTNTTAYTALNYISANVTAINAGGIKNVTIYLYNSTGLYNSINSTASQLFINWTGLPNGVYYFNATAYDNAGNFNKTETRNVTINASTGGVPSITGLNLNATSANNLSSDNLTCNYALSANATTSAVAWYQNSNPIMVLYLPFDGNSTNALLDYSGYGNSATIASSPVWNSSGGYNGSSAYVFNGANDYISVPNYSALSLTGGVTLVARVMRNDRLNDNYTQILSKNGSYVMFISDNRSRVYCGNSTAWIRTKEALIIPNRWQTIACVINGSNISIYMDTGGVPAYPSAPIYALGDSVTSGTPYHKLAWHVVGGNQGFDGGNLTDLQDSYPYWLDVYARTYVGSESVNKSPVVQGGYEPFHYNKGIYGGYCTEFLGPTTHAGNGTAFDFYAVEVPNGSTVISMCGINDLYSGRSVAQIETNISQLYNRSVSKGDHMILMAITPNNYVSCANVKTINTWLKNFTATNNIPFVDTWTPMVSATDNCSLNSSYDSGDGLHPSAAGEKAIALAIWHTIFNNQTWNNTVVQQATEIVNGWTGIGSTNSGPLYIGALANGSYPINASIDYVQVYQRALSSQELGQLFNNSPVMASQELQAGDVWQCQVTPFNASAAGTTSSSNSVAINANASAPAITATLNSPVNSYNSSSSTVNFNWTCSNNFSSFLSNLTVDGVLNASGISSLNNVAVNRTVTGIADGNHSWSVTCWNGTDSGISALYNFTVDTVNPAITFTTPTTNTTAYTTLNYVSANVTAINAGGIKNITIYLYNSTGLYSSTNGTTSPLFINWTGLPNGVYYFNATAYDNAGNFNKTETRNVTINASAAGAPSITGLGLSSTSGNNVITDNLTCSYALSGSATTAAVAWYRNNSPVMALYMPMEGNSANELLDYSGNGNNGTNVGSVAWNSAGGYDGNGSFNFSGANCVTVPLTQSLNITRNITLTAWVRKTPGSAAAYGDIIMMPSPTFAAPYAAYAIVWGSANHIRMYLSNGAENSFDGTSTLSTGVWYFFAAVYNGVNMTVYVNGAYDGVHAFTGPITTYNTNISIGCADYPPGSNLYFNGSIDDARIYNRSLSAQEITALYQNKSNTIVSQELAVGDVWQCQVTPFNASSAGTTSSSNSVAINANASAPAITATLNSPVNSYNSSSSTVDFNWTCSNNFTTFLANLTIDGAINANGIASPNGVAVNRTVTGLADGNHNWSVTCLNGTNFNTSALYGFTVDTVNPAITFTTPTTNTTAYTTLNYVSANVTAINTGGIKNVTIYLYNSTGLYNSTTGTASSLFVNRTGLSNGVYYFNATAYDNAGNFNKTETRNVTIDTINPTITFTMPTDNSSAYLARSNLVVNVSASDGNFANLSIYVYNSTGGIVRSNSTTSTQLFVNYTGLADGLYYFNATAYDNAGNFNKTETRNVTIATSVSVALNSPVNSYNSSSSTVDFNWTCSNNFTTFLANLTIDGAINANGIASPNGVAVNRTVTGLADGNHNWSVTCLNGTNFNTSALYGFTVDTVNPAITFITPTDNSSASAGRRFVQINVTATDPGLGLKNMTVFLYNSTGALINSSNTAAPSLFANFSVNADGVYYFNATAFDLVGNFNKTETRNVTIDTVNPTIAFTTPTDNSSSIASRAFVQVNVSATDSGSGLSGVTIYLYNGTGGLVNSSTGTSSPLFANFSVNKDGIYYFNATAYDNAGNFNKTETRNVTVDTVNPEIAFMTPTENSSTTLNRSYVQINVSATDANFKNITAYLYNSMGLYNSTSSTTSPLFMDWTGLPNGLYYFNATAYDNAGNFNKTETRNVTLSEPANCPVLSTAGQAYAMGSDFFGAPNDATPQSGVACVKITASNVTFDCNGYNITNNGTGGQTFGILLTSGLTNVTVKNCQGVSGYTYGIYSVQQINVCQYTP